MGGGEEEEEEDEEKGEEEEGEKALRFCFRALPPRMSAARRRVARKFSCEEHRAQYQYGADMHR